MPAQATTVRKTKILAVLQQNRAKHRRVFEAAVDGYRKEATRRLEENLDALRAGKLPTVSIHLPLPQDHTRDYDRVIKMIEMDTGETWTMNEQDFARYIEDDWDWKRHFVTMSSVYAAGSVKAEYGDLDED